jgi:hypothetical protein
MKNGKAYSILRKLEGASERRGGTKKATVWLRFGNEIEVELFVLNAISVLQ